MWKLALAFVAGVVLGWLLAVTTQPPAPSPAPAPAPAAERPVRDAPGPTRTPRMHAPGETPAANPAADTAKKAKAVKTPAPAEAVLSDAEIGALLGDASSAARCKGLNLAARRGLVSIAHLLDRARGDPDRDVRLTAFHLAVGCASEDDGTMALAAAEILAWARDADPDRRRAGLQHLGETGARGAGLGRELLDDGGLPSDIYENAVRTLVAAQQFDRLAPDPLDDDSRGILMNVLAAALGDDPSIAPRVAAVLRETGPPKSAEQVSDWCGVALRAGAAALVRDLVKSPAAAPEVRATALEVLVEDEAQAAFAVGLAEDVLTGTASPPGLRRRILDAAGSGLASQGAPGLAVLRRVRDHDPNAWVRALAAEYVADAESR